MDSACDQSIINTQAFDIISKTGTQFYVDGALAERMQSTKALEVGTGATLVTLQDGSKHILVVHQALIDTCSGQKEALLQPHQCRAHGVAVDDCASRHNHVDGSPGGQCIQVDDCRIPLYYDGYKCYLSVSKPTQDDYNRYSQLEMTSPQPYEPDKRIYTRRRRTRADDNVKEWRAKLGYPAMEVVKQTLKNTTRLVNTVEAETRDYMRDHFKPRLECLRPHRVNDICFSDTFFADVRSVRGFDKFQMFSLKECGHDVPYLIRKESQASSKLADYIREVGAPRALVNDNAKTMTGESWMNICRRFCIETHNSEAYHQNQNLAERRGGMLKHAIIKLYHNSPHAPIEFWCYALEYLALVRGCLSRKSLGWRPSEELLYGETLDISAFCFPWFSPIWYYDPHQLFPKDKMVPGFFLNVAPTVGDAFCYQILPLSEYEKFLRHKRYNPHVLTRSVVRKRNPKDSDAPSILTSNQGFTITNSKGEVLETEDNVYVNNVSFEDDSTWPEDVAGSEETTDEFIIDDDGNIIVPPIAAATDPFEADLKSEEIPQDYPIPSNTDDARSNRDSDPRPGPVLVEDVSDSDDDDISVTSTADNDTANDVNNHFHPSQEDYEEYDDILSHRWNDGSLELEVLYTNGEKEFILFDLVQDTDPWGTSAYVLDSELGSDKSLLKYGRWARKFRREVRRSLRRMSSVFRHKQPTPKADEPRKTLASRRLNTDAPAQARKKKKTKPGRNKRIPQTKFGIKVPADFDQAVEFDEENGNRKWQDAVEKEIAALIFHKCFDFKSPNYKPSSDYQYARLNLVFEVKQDLRQKMRLVIMGNLVDPRGLSTRATVVKGISVRLLSVIAHRDGLKELCGDIGNAFIQAHTSEKVYTRCGPAFGDKEGCIALIIRALYGLTTSAERFRTLLADFIRSLGFVPTRYDRDVWMRLREARDGYDYICTHVDDFKIVARDPDHWLIKIKERFLVKTSGPPDYYLGNDYRFEETEGIWTVGSTTYTKEAIRKVEEKHKCLPKCKTPLLTKDCHPETDTTPLLGENDHRFFQMLIGMGQWLNTIGRFDICYAMCSLSRFGACPREGHLALALRVFSYLKMFPDRRLAMDSSDIDFSDLQAEDVTEPFRPDFLQDYPWAKEELDPNFPEAFGRPLQTTILCDADHAHDTKTRRSVTGILAFVGCTIVFWRSTRQSAIACSTYAAEFMAIRTATEEAISIRYMLRCLGIPIPADGSCPTHLFGDNLSVIQNATNHEADIKKKHVALSFHFVREAIAAGIISPNWLKGKFNKSDIMTKQIGSVEFLSHCDNMFWCPQHRR